MRAQAEEVRVENLVRRSLVGQRQTSLLLGDFRRCLRGIKRLHHDAHVVHPLQRQAVTVADRKTPMNFRCATGLYCVRIRKRGSADTTDRQEPSMTQPVTELDARFSDPAAVAADWDQPRRTLEDAELFWIATVRADGRPHATPLVGVWLDDTIYFATGFRE